MFKKTYPRRSICHGGATYSAHSSKRHVRGSVFSSAYLQEKKYVTFLKLIITNNEKTFIIGFMLIFIKHFCTKRRVKLEKGR
ncbi:hypothetical protein CCAND95_420002 [Capnocytophaga canis]|uniref:Uncharacterized protein n=1 Tax=Capnocytophaga canis TaxID=1848903 RepID=A0A0B7I161_9FLAO|nr:hypothetical protein CCAND95_420002 [Capnocytophaga canis]CEN45420.1 hypothetical protein CCAND38_240030 [Capnocytophaga canis]